MEDKGRSRQDGKEILAVCRNFLQALLDKEDWHPYGQKHYMGTKLEPNIPQYYRHTVIKTRKVKGMNNLVAKDVDIRLELVPSGHMGMRWADYRLRVVKELGPYAPSADDGTWGVVPTSCRFVAWRNDG